MQSTARPMPAIIAVAVTLTVMVATGFGLYLLFVAVLDKLNGLNSEIAKAVITGAIALVVAVISLVLGKIWEQKIKIRQELRERKVIIYEAQIKTFFGVLLASKVGREPMKGPELQQAFIDFTEKLIIWGGPNVIRAWAKFRENAKRNGPPVEQLLVFEEMLLAIRKELGNSNHGISKGMLTKLFVNDYDAAINIRGTDQEKAINEGE